MPPFFDTIDRDSDAESEWGSDVSSDVSNLKGVFCGSGSDMMNDPRPAQKIVEMVGKPSKDIFVVYLGTATYDIHVFRKRQTEQFQKLGCQVYALEIANSDDDIPENMHEMIRTADVIVVGGGNTVYATDRWRNLNIDRSLERAMENGAILSGGSCGAICWFDGGHSNAMDPDTYREARLEKFSTATNMVGDESDSSSTEIKAWKYIRVPTLGLLPGLVSPHHDRIQSNGILRASDFDKCLLTTPGERGIGIDHWAALVVDGERYEVMSLREKEGSVKNGYEFVTDGSGDPGIWIKEVVNGKVEQRVCPKKGLLKDLLRLPTKIRNDAESLRQCRKGNPQPCCT